MCGGVKRINLYDQTQESKGGGQSRRKTVQDYNKESDGEDSCRVFMVKRIAGHKHSQMDWHNAVTSLKLAKK